MTKRKLLTKQSSGTTTFREAHAPCAYDRLNSELDKRRPLDLDVVATVPVRSAFSLKERGPLTM